MPSVAGSAALGAPTRLGLGALGGATVCVVVGVVVSLLTIERGKLVSSGPARAPC